MLRIRPFLLPTLPPSPPSPPLTPSTSARNVMQSVATKTTKNPEERVSGAPYFLICAACKWSSKEIGWLFDKPSGLAGQSERQFSQSELVQGEYDSLKDSLEKYIAQSGPPPAAQKPDKEKRQSHQRAPSRHLAQIAASRALGREVPGLPPLKSSGRKARLRREEGDKGGATRDEMPPYVAKGSWRDKGLECGLADVDAMREMEAKHFPPPDAKSVRMPIKVVAFNYLPTVELGRRRRRMAEELNEDATDEELERKRRERRRTRLPPGREEDEPMSAPLLAGEVYSFQMAFTNPLYDPIQIRLAPAHQPKLPVPANHHIFIPTAHFTVGALKDAWAYDEEDEDEGGSDDGLGGVVDGVKGRMGLGAHRHRGRELGVEKRGNVTKVGLEVEVYKEATGPVEFDLEVRFTYRADEGEGSKEGAKAEYKTFTFWSRMCAGEVSDE
ncbi:uncharacterized protein CcaverHIS019_0303820 [Cutaneotrichosporon cavernicola]|uniref:Dynactin subunit 4 n=1 Tax=Cutaneotrichosporon cavernicola TaxID=279322 RepID=A0AA48I6Q6_9TREE|nr:uncharacterized protein CcaverHIS019_0303820 [Cutaneotrichosporon cavernicola]BEI90312.1 hypothetical protein CcaverHIS019_0303820 [Cutaneotrichosporon cavernicola]